MRQMLEKSNDGQEQIKRKFVGNESLAIQRTRSSSKTIESLRWLATVSLEVRKLLGVAVVGSESVEIQRITASVKKNEKGSYSSIYKGKALILQLVSFRSCNQVDTLHEPPAEAIDLKECS